MDELARVGWGENGCAFVCVSVFFDRIVSATHSQFLRMFCVHEFSLSLSLSLALSVLFPSLFLCVKFGK